MWESMHIDGVPPGIGGGMVEAEMNENNGGGGADDAIETSANGGGRSAQNANYVVENPTLDLEIYVQGYSGLARLHRLLFVAHHCPLLRVEALRLGVNYVMSTYNTGLYLTMHKKLVEAATGASEASAAAAASSSNPNLPDLAASSAVAGVPPSPGTSSSATTSGAPDKAALAALLPDHAWIETKNKKAALKLEKLDTDLKNYKSNSIKESIRRGHDDLGDHFLDCGDLNSALKCYSRARDYCTSGRHVINMCLNVIKVSVYLQNWSHVVSYVNKALSTPDFSENTSVKGQENNITILTRLNCAHGLADLATRKYKSAAKHFLAANLDHCDIPDLMSTANVATYGGICALATFDRAELQKQVISSSSFKLFLELDPLLREIIFNFHESKYGKCLKMLEEIRDNLMLDMYLANHVKTLYSMIRNRGLIQYFSPYLSADLRLMASCFNTSIADLEDELMILILDGQIQARIDSHNKVLHAQDVDQRSAIFEKALEMGDLYKRRCNMTILRSAVLKNNIVVKTARQEQAGVAEGGGGGGGGGHGSIIMQSGSDV